MGFAIRIGLVMLLFIPAGIYLFIYLRRTAVFWGMDTKRLFVRLFLIAMTVILMLASAAIFTTTALIVLHLIVFALFMELINIVIKIICRVKRNRDAQYDCQRPPTKKKGVRIWQSLYQCGLMPIGLSLIVFAFGYINISNVVRTEYNVETKKSIREEGYKIALIADLHYGNSMSKEKLIGYCEKISVEKPDIVVLCGDIVDEDTTLQGMKDAFSILGGIERNYSTFFVYGNHDRSRYSAAPNYTEEQLRETIEMNGIIILQDNSVRINDEFLVIGREDVGFSRETSRPATTSFLKEGDENSFLLMLDHQPVGFTENETAGIDLQLSGHTHAGQIFPVGYINAFLKLSELNYGRKQIGDFQVIVTSGIAGWGYPIRTQEHSEYVIINVKR